MENLNENNIPEIDDDTETMKQSGGWKKELKDWVITIAAAIIIAYVLQTFVLQFACVSGPSMEQTLHDKDVLYVNKLMYTPERGDVVIVNTESLIDPNDPNYEARMKEKYHIKRVIAIAGDTLYIDDQTGEVYLNDLIIDEPYINNSTTINGQFLYDLLMNGEFTRKNPLVIGENEVFVMGDNRQHSLDSRHNGPYTVDMIEGHAIFRLWPLSDFGGFEKE